MKVSVVIPVYNVGPYVGDAIRSVLEQSCKDFELIIVDDRGDDDSMAVAEALAAEDNRIKIIRNPENLGLAASRNAGLSQASGEYVYFLDGDDMIVPHALLVLCDRAEADDADAVIFEAEFIYENKDLEEKFRGNPARFKGDYDDVLSGKELFVRWMDLWDWMPSQPRFFYRRSFLTDHGLKYIDGMLHEDEIFTFDVLMNAGRIRVLKEPLFIRRFRSSSIMTGGVTKRNVEGCIKILRRVRDEKTGTDDQELRDAMDFYMGKISDNARGKISSIEGYVPEVTVIIPVYNTERYTGECLDSLISQTLWDFEIIAVDDCSTDGSPDLLKRYVKTEPRLKIYVNEQNKGQAFTRNEGLSKAAGKYVYFLDSDDLILPETLEELTAVADKDGSDVVAFGHRQFTSDKKYAKEAEGVLFSYEGIEGSGKGPDIFRKCIFSENYSPSVPTYFIRKSFIDSQGLRFIEGIIHEDIGFIYEMMTRSSVTTLVSKAYFQRRLRGGSTVTSAPDRKKFEGYIRSFERSLELDGDTSDPAILKWRRDVAGRIRQLYDEAGRCAGGGHAIGGEDTTRRIYDILKLSHPSGSDCENILTPQLCRFLTENGGIYICGDGQYANLMIDMAPSLDVVIKGALVLTKTRRSMRGIPLITFDETDGCDKDVPVILTVSHFTKEQYRNAVSEAGFTSVTDIPEGY